MELLQGEGQQGIGEDGGKFVSFSVRVDVDKFVLCFHKRVELSISM